MRTQKLFLILCGIAILSCNKSVGQTWSALGSGVNGNVSSLCAFDSILYAGGQFTTASGNSARNIGQWNGSTWSNLGSGVNGNVNAMIVFDGKLYVAGAFDSAGGKLVNYVAVWNGLSWSALGTGLAAQANCFVIFNNNLYVGWASGVSEWNGSSWSLVGSGITGSEVYALQVYAGNLYAGGGLAATAKCTNCNYIAEWNGTSWVSLGTGMNDIVYALAVYNGSLYAGGSFGTANGSAAYFIASWNGASWSMVCSGGTSGGMDGTVSALTVFKSDLYLGGQFTSGCGNSMNYIGEWNGSTWTILGTGLNYWDDALAIYNGNLYAGGGFTKAGGSTVNYVAEWSKAVTGIDNMKVLNSVEVYPNPSYGTFSIILHNAYKQGTVKIYNIIGEEIFTGTIQAGSNAINLGAQSPGIYIYRITDKDGLNVGSGKLVVE